MTSHPAVAAFQTRHGTGIAAPVDPWASADPACLETGQRMQRSAGLVEIGFRADGAVTRLVRAYQSGCGRVRMPRQHGVPHPCGILINTAGGLTGGDRFHVRATLTEGARAVLTSQAAEKIYRSAAGVAEIDNAISLSPGTTLDWLPQETILFDRGALHRRTQVAMAADATLTATELIVFGRTAMGETVESGTIADSWRIVRDGRLVFADATRLAGPIQATLGQPATAAGAAGLALVLHVAPDAGDRLAAVRKIMGGAPGVRGGASAYDGVLVSRMIAESGATLRAAVLQVMGCLRDGLTPPRPWLI